VNGQRGANVRWRRGYSIDAAPAAAPSPEPRPARSFPLPRTLAEFVAAFDRGDAAAIEKGLTALYGEQYLATRYRDARRLFQDLQTAVALWPGDLGREAAFALTVAEAAASQPLNMADREFAAILTRYSRLLRHPIEPDELERAYLWAQSCLAQGAFQRVSAETAADAALARFPGDPRFVLAAAIALDQQRRSSLLETHVAQVTARYTAAAAFAETRAEAMIRLSWLQHRLGRSAEALSTLDRAPIAGRDLDMDYLHHLFRGHYQLALGRPDEAIAAYRSAATVLPGAQSARIALMNTLALKGEISQATAVGNETETMSTGADPWWTFWFGDQRWLPQALKALGEARR
jgi:tetratricopeptide (TPR) repeat protein